jgi:hypothetical protein
MIDQEQGEEEQSRQREARAKAEERTCPGFEKEERPTLVQGSEQTVYSSLRNSDR